MYTVPLLYCNWWPFVCASLIKELLWDKFGISWIFLYLYLIAIVYNVWRWISILREYERSDPKDAMPCSVHMGAMFECNTNPISDRAWILFFFLNESLIPRSMQIDFKHSSQKYNKWLLNAAQYDSESPFMTPLFSSWRCRLLQDKENRWN